MKTQEEIKKGLELCPQTQPNLCGECPYWCGSIACIPRMPKDARDCIEQLEDNIAERNRMAPCVIRMIPRWVSIKERQPERDGLYYCHTAMWGDIMCRYANGRWVDDRARFTNFPRRPTHWLEIPEVPEPPKEDKNAT